MTHPYTEVVIPLNNNRIDWEKGKKYISQTTKLHTVNVPLAGTDWPS